MIAADPLRHALAQELPATAVLDAAGALRLTEGSAVVVLDAWTLGTAEELSRHALAHPVTLVPVRGDGALTVVGPVLRPGARGCLACGEYRRLATIGGRVPWHSPGLRLEGRPSPRSPTPSVFWPHRSRTATGRSSMSSTTAGAPGRPTASSPSAGARSACRCRPTVPRSPRRPSARPRAAPRGPRRPGVAA